MNLTRFLLLLIGLASFAACDIINPSEEIPAYIYVESFELQTTASQGTNSAKITEVHLSVGPNFIGAFPLPALIPVLENGDQEVVLSAGIKDNGINSTPEIYPFYDTYETIVNLQPTEIDTLRPVIQYNPNAKFAFVEAFQSNGHIFQFNETGPQIMITSDGAFEDNSARIQLTRDQPEVEIATNLFFEDIYDTDLRLYLEVNYKSEVPVIFGLTGLTSSTQVLGSRLYNPGFSPKEVWNKIYFNLSGLDPLNEFNGYRVGFYGFIPEEDGELTLEEANIWLDNIKLVHF